MNIMKSPINALNSPKDNSLSSPASEKTTTRKASTESNKGHSVVDLHPSSVKEIENLSTSNSGKPVISKVSKKKRESVKNNKSSRSTPKFKIANKSKLPVVNKNDSRIVPNKNVKKAEVQENRDQIVTRNRSRFELIGIAVFRYSGFGVSL